MSKRIEPDLIRHIASLSRIELEEERIPVIIEQFGRILSYFDKLNELDTETAAPMTRAVELSNVMQDDTVSSSLSREEGLSNAPDRDDSYFKVPKVLGDS